MDSCLRSGSCSGEAARGRGTRRESSGSSNNRFAARIRCMYVFVFAPAGGVCSPIDSNTQSLSTDVFLQLLERSGVAMHGMPASNTLSNAFSNTFRHATPTMASMWPLTMIFNTIGVPSLTSTL